MADVGFSDEEVRRMLAKSNGKARVATTATKLGNGSASSAAKRGGGLGKQSRMIASVSPSLQSTHGPQSKQLKDDQNPTLGGGKAGSAGTKAIAQTYPTTTTQTLHNNLESGQVAGSHSEAKQSQDTAPEKVSGTGKGDSKPLTQQSQPIAAKAPEEMESELKDKVVASQALSDSPASALDTSKDHAKPCADSGDSEVAEHQRVQLTLEEVARRKKQMEEENRKRREMIQQTLQARQTQAAVEARRLKQVQSELQQLDVSLSNDISLVRARIDVASRAYSSARDRLVAAEKEYVEAKVQEAKARELKEQLTEHLMLIIQKNEERKALKLDELMKKISALEQESTPAPPQP
eukprot:m.47691 g.47691  ORF g.47691 m.47691 type:complete len:350 (-) comp10988_c0_seq3:2155-3204(-)